MPLYLSLLDDAVAHFLEGFDLYRQQKRKAAERREALKIARAIVSIHLSVEKVLKHVLSQIDPNLVIHRLEGKLVQDLRREQIAQGLPSILASSRKIETLPLLGLWNVYVDVARPSLDPQIMEQFRIHSETLSLLRNQTVHAELYGESNELLNVITNVLSRIRLIFEYACPAFLKTIYKENDQAESILKAIEKEIDEGWQIVADYLEAGNAIKAPLEVYAVLESPQQNLEVLISGKDRPGDNRSITATQYVPPDDVEGFFLRPVLKEEGRFYKSETLLFQPTRVVKGLPLLEKGELYVRRALGYAYLNLTGRRKPFVGLNIQLRGWKFTLVPPQTTGRVSGIITPAAGVKTGDSINEIQVVGEVWLNAEYVSYVESEADPIVDTLKSVRQLRGEINLSMSSKSTT